MGTLSPDPGRASPGTATRTRPSCSTTGFSDRPLLTRVGGYWWDGDTWYRPRQVLSWATEGYVRLPTNITTADLLDSSCEAAWGS